MQIKNNTDIAVSWFCFNQKDMVKLIALASGDLNSGNVFDYTPPKNSNDRYFVRFTYRGGGAALAGGATTRTGQTITISGKNDAYNASVSNQ